MTDSKIKMLVVPDDYTGVSKFRSIEPHTYIQEHWPDEFDIDIMYLKDFPHDNLADFLSKYDLIQIHKQLDRNLTVMNTIKYLGIPVVLDIDDYFDIGPDHPLYITAKNERWKDSILGHVKLADYVTTTTDIFADILRKHNKNVFVISNAVNPEEPQFVQKKNPSRRIRFGIVCGSAHLKDIELLRGIDSLPQDVRDKMQIVLCGFDTRGKSTVYNPKTGESKTRDIMPYESVWARYEEILTKNYKLVTKEHEDFLKLYLTSVDDPFDNDYYRRFWTKEIAKYAKHYENVDVLLAPLKENTFNLVKSQLKEIEAGFTDTAIIAQNYGPYTFDLIPYIEKGGVINENGNALLVDSDKNHKQWAKYIKYVVEHPECIDIMKKNLSRMVREKYSIDTVCRQRVELYKRIIAEKKE